MLWLFLGLLVVLIILYVKDHLKGLSASSKDISIPIKGIFVTGILYYLISKGLISKEEEKVWEDKSLEELESFVLENNLLTKVEWVEVCLFECQTLNFQEMEKDLSL